MKFITLSKKDVDKIIEESPTHVDILLSVFKKVIDIDWDLIESIKHHPKCHTDTAMYIIDAMAVKSDRMTANFTWLQKGFSTDENLKPFVFAIPDDCYTLKTDNVSFKDEIMGLTAGYGEVEIEELGEDPKESIKDEG